MRRKILVVDTEPNVVKSLTSNLLATGFQVIVATDGTSALAKAKSEMPSLIVLNLGFPDIRGFDACRSLKLNGSTRHIPIIILSARATEQDRILGFELGADDYVARPFSVLEVILRIKKSIQRYADNLNELAAKRKMSVGAVVLDPSRHEVAIGDNLIHLTSTEFKLLGLLMENQGGVLERQVLFTSIWGQDSYSDSRTIDQHVKRLRQKLANAGCSIETINGFGYRLNESSIPPSKNVPLQISPIESEHVAPRKRGKRKPKVIRFRNHMHLSARAPSLLHAAAAP